MGAAPVHRFAGALGALAYQFGQQAASSNPFEPVQRPVRIPSVRFEPVRRTCGTGLPVRLSRLPQILSASQEDMITRSRTIYMRIMAASTQTCNVRSHFGSSSSETLRLQLLTRCFAFVFPSWLGRQHSMRLSASARKRSISRAYRVSTSAWKCSQTKFRVRSQRS